MGYSPSVLQVTVHNVTLKLPFKDSKKKYKKVIFYHTCLTHPPPPQTHLWPPYCNFYSCFTHGPHRRNHVSSDGNCLLLHFLLHTTNFPGSPVTPISSYSFSFYFLECFCPENCPLLSGEVSTNSRQSSDSYLSSVQSSPGLDIKLSQT